MGVVVTVNKTDEGKMDDLIIFCEIFSHIPMGRYFKTCSRHTQPKRISQEGQSLMTNLYLVTCHLFCASIRINADWTTLTTVYVYSFIRFLMSLL